MKPKIKPVLVCKCGRCGGSGKDPDHEGERCLSCGGSGKVRIRR
jgi:DnaJ-class molecular chaperone